MDVRDAALAALLVVAAAPAAAQSIDSLPAYDAADCPSCTEWNAPTAPFRLHGNTWYVGTRGLSAVLITSDSGHVLVDAGLPGSAPRIAASIRRLGFRVEDIRLIVNSHAHYDHAGGVAALQRASGARVAAMASSADAMGLGRVGRDDPQHDVHLDYPAVARVDTIGDGDTLRVGATTLVAHLTAGHTPGGTTWSWQSCEDGACLEIVYADSQTPISADAFSFTGSRDYPTAIADFERGFARLESLQCDILVTPHPGASRLFERVAVSTDGPPLVDRGACRRYAANAREQLQRRIARERTRG